MNTRRARKSKFQSVEFASIFVTEEPVNSMTTAVFRMTPTSFPLHELRRKRRLMLVPGLVRLVVDAGAAPRRLEMPVNPVGEDVPAEGVDPGRRQSKIQRMMLKTKRPQKGKVAQNAAEIDGKERKATRMAKKVPLTLREMRSLTVMPKTEVERVAGVLARRSLRCATSLKLAMSVNTPMNVASSMVKRITAT
jgi:hypothetical protein